MPSYPLKKKEVGFELTDIHKKIAEITAEASFKVKVDGAGDLNITLNLIVKKGNYKAYGDKLNDGFYFDKGEIQIPETLPILLMKNLEDKEFEIRESKRPKRIPNNETGSLDIKIVADCLIDSKKHTTGS